MKKQLKKVVAYCRVSTDNLDQLNSYENQKAYFENELCQKNGFELINIFADRGLTGTKFKNRPEFNDMMERAGLDIDVVNNKYIYTANKYKEPDFNYIYVTNTSRFARNVECISIIRALKDKGVYVVFQDLNKSTENAEDEMVLQLLFTMDEQESKDKSIKVTNGYRRSATRTDKIHTNSKLYGYKYIKEENRLEIVKEEAEVVRLIFKLSAEGLGQRRIIKELNKRGIKTRKGKEFAVNSINYIQKNIKYVGKSARLMFSSPKLFSGETCVKRNSLEDSIVKDTDRIPAIITMEEFEKAQEVLQSRIVKGADGSVLRGTYTGGKNKYVGTLKCGYCNSNYIYNVDKGRVFYNCSKKKSKGVKACGNKNLSLINLEAKLEEFRGGFYIYICEQFESIKTIIENKIEEYNAIIKNEDINDEINKVNLNIKELNKKSNKLLDLYLDSALDKEMYEAKKRSLEKELGVLNEQLEKLKNGESQYITLRSELIYLRNEIKRQIENSKDIDKDQMVNEIETATITGEKIEIKTYLEAMIDEIKKSCE